MFALAFGRGMTRRFWEKNRSNRADRFGPDGGEDLFNRVPLAAIFPIGEIILLMNQVDVGGKFSANLRPLTLECRRARKLGNFRTRPPVH